jgi:CSLREA domain-containing protein
MTHRRILLASTLTVALGAAAARPASAQTCSGGTVQVTSHADTDDGTCGPQCTLREAIHAANAGADCTRITFSLPPGEIFAISPLPTITTPVHILGWTDPGSQRIGPDGEGPSIGVVVNGQTHNIAGPGLRLLDAPGSLIEGLWIRGFASGAAIEVVATTDADQQITIRENTLGMLFESAVTNRNGISVQARGVHIGGFAGEPYPDDMATALQLPDPVDWRAGNIIRGTTGPGIVVTTSPTGVHGQARILGNHIDYWQIFTLPMAVDLGPAGRTPNDPGDVDVGPNDLQNAPEVRFEPFRFEEPPEGAPPCSPNTDPPYGGCDAVRIIATLRDAPSGTYTAELHGGYLGDVFNNDGQPERFRTMGTRTRTGSGDLTFVFELPLSTSDAARNIVNFLVVNPIVEPNVYVSISQGNVSSFSGPTSEWAGGHSQGSNPGPAPQTFVRMFAEGATGSFFDTTFTLSNFGAASASATMYFNTDQGELVTHPVQVPAGGHPVTVRAAAVPGLASANFGTMIASDAPLVSSRTMSWDATGYGTASDAGVAAARNHWFLAEGVTGAFDTYVLVYNPSMVAAPITMTFYRVAPLPPIARLYFVPASGRLTVRVNDVDPELAATDVAVLVESVIAGPVVVERSVYLSSPTTVYEAGTSTSASSVETTWYFGEGAALGTFDTFLLLFNPNGTEATVDVRYLRRFGAPVTRSYVVAPRSRLSIWTDLIPELDGQEFGMVVTSTNGLGVAAERAMWGGGQAFIDGHASPGITTPSIRWGLNGGEANAAAGADTYVLIVNPTTTNATARVTLFFDDGTTSPAREVAVAAERRTNVSVAAEFPEANGKRFSILVESVGAGTPALVVERSTYTSPGGVVWRAASNEAGTPLP